MVRAVGILERRYDIRPLLIIVGGESASPDPQQTPEIGRLQRIAADERITHDVLFVGQRSRSELRYYYSAADVFVTMPWYEPFGITPVEAMACGVPVIGSRVGGVQYSVEDGRTGLDEIRGTRSDIGDGRHGPRRTTMRPNRSLGQSTSAIPSNVPFSSLLKPFAV